MEYRLAHSVREALMIMKNAGGKATVIAGGTDVIVDRNAGKINPELLVDITRIPELKQIKFEDCKFHIGAAVTLSEIAQSPIFRAAVPSLCKGCGTVGSMQIRNSATLVGNVLSAQPAADGAMALAAFEPVFTVYSANNGTSRECDMHSLYAGFGRTAINNHKELVTEITFPMLEVNEAASFRRLELRKSLSLPMLNVATKLGIKNGIITKAVICMAPVGVGPTRAVEAEKFLVGKAPEDAAFAEAGMLALKNANPRSNPLRGSKEYRIETLPILVRRALEECRDQL